MPVKPDLNSPPLHSTLVKMGLCGQPRAMFSGANERQIPHGITPFAQVVMISAYINGPRIAILEEFVAPLRPILLGQLSVTGNTGSSPTARNLCSQLPGVCESCGFANILSTRRHTPTVERKGAAVSQTNPEEHPPLSLNTEQKPAGSPTWMFSGVSPKTPKEPIRKATLLMGSR